MRRPMILSLLFTSACAAVVLSAPDAPLRDDPATREVNKPVNKFCAVERMSEVDPRIPTVVYQGKRIGFCCADCVQAFQKDPAKYAKDLK